MELISFEPDDFALLISITDGYLKVLDLEKQLSESGLALRADEDIEIDTAEVRDLLKRLKKLYSLMEKDNDQDTGDFYAKL